MAYEDFEKLVMHQNPSERLTANYDDPRSAFSSDSSNYDTESHDTVDSINQDDSEHGILTSFEEAPQLPPMSFSDPQFSAEMLAVISQYF